MYLLSDRVPSPSQDPRTYQYIKDMQNYKGIYLDGNVDRRNYPANQYYFEKGPHTYQTLPSKRSQVFQIDNPERSVTPDITRGLDRNFHVDKRALYNYSYPHDLGIPIKIPDVNSFGKQVPSEKPNTHFPHISPHNEYNDDSIKISPIDPRNMGGFQTSTPASMKAAVNLENLLLSPKKSTMSNDELYAVIHKSKKKMNIISGENKTPPSPIYSENAKNPKSPETGYIGDKSRSRLSWSPTKGEYIDFNQDIDKLSPPNGSRSRQSWACSDRKGPPQTSRMDFKKLLLQKSSVFSGGTKKLSAVEQLKLSKQQIQKSQLPPPINILELSGSPRSLVNRKFPNNGGPSSPKTTPEKPKPPIKLMSPRSQWRFASPRSDVLSSTILEDCREDESPNNSIEKKKASPVIQDKQFSSISQKIHAQRAQFFKPNNTQSKQEQCSVPPTLETAF